ncbi:hypothetical protein DWB64_16725 [Fusibacter sp. A1]|nr:hypothetical protein DWB64_16725 [Fusibacter sp. A1]
MIITDVPAEFGAQDKNISECIIEFDTSGGALTAKKIDITLEHDETTVTMVEVEKIVEKQIEKTISKEIEILHSLKEDNGILLQVGANSGQTLSVSIDDMRPDALGFVDDMPRVNPIEMAGVSLTLSDQVLNRISSQRSKLGAQQNALEHVIKNVDNASEQLQAAESRIDDVDMAKEMMLLTKFKILEEATNAMMAQSNQLPQGILQLLR